MAGGFGPSIVLGIVKSIVCLYDVISLPIYFFIQQPWKQWNQEEILWADHATPRDSKSPYVRKKIIYHLPENVYQDSSSLNALFETSVQRYPERPCFGAREVFGQEDEVQPDGRIFKKRLMSPDYKWVTYREVDKKIEGLSKSFLSVGLEPKENVLIFAETRMEWLMSALAVFRLGGIVATLYPTLGEEGIVYGINETGVSKIITTEELLPKLRNLISQTPSVKLIICMETYGSSFSVRDFPEGVMVITLSQFETLGNTLKQEIVYPKVTRNDTALIMYTSGSTGIPKGVVLSHGNILCMSSALYLNYGKEILCGRPLLGYLPLAHIFEFTVEFYVIGCGMCIGYSSPNTLTDKSTAIKAGDKGDMTVIQPGILIGVPVLLDRIRKGVHETIETKGAFAKGLFEFAMAHHTFWGKKGFRTPLMDKIVFGKIRSVIGKHMKFICSGGAPLSPDTQEFARICLGTKVFQGYGLTETAGVGTMMHFSEDSVGLVGPPAFGSYMRLADWKEGGYCTSDKPNPRGEIVIGGPSIAQGYYKKDDLTTESFLVEDGIRWFYTGDIGEVFPGGSIKIIDRKKALVKLQNGEYVSLTKVETELKTCPVVENICVLGDSFSNFVVALIVPNRVLLHALAAKISPKKKEFSFEELCDDPDVVSEMLRIVKEHAVLCKLVKTEIPQKVKLCKEEWTPENNLVTATFKVRRHFIQQFYQNEVDKLYSKDGQITNGTTKLVSR